MRKISIAIITAIFSLPFFLPQIVSAHEVYVLTRLQINHDLQIHTLNVFTSLRSSQNVLWFLLFAFFAIVSLSSSFLLSLSPWGVRTTKSIEKFSRFAFPIIRILFGISLIYSAHYTSLFGPELSLTHILGNNLWVYILYIAGALVIVGLFTRIVAMILFLLFLLAILAYHQYMITYTNYFGEMLVLLLAGAEGYSLDAILFKRQHISLSIKKITVPILRISFGLSLLYAGIYVKFLHPALSYQVVTQYYLTKFFPFDPLFIVLGAGCVEIVIALLFIFGINMRWNILFFTFWVTLSLLYFGEAVWPHIILFGIAIGLFLYGYDSFTLENWVVKKTKNCLTVLSNFKK